MLIPIALTLLVPFNLKLRKWEELNPDNLFLHVFIVQKNKCCKIETPAPLFKSNGVCLKLYLHLRLYKHSYRPHTMLIQGPNK